MKNIKDIVAKNLIKIRKQNGLTQSELSNKINYVHFPLSAFTVTGWFHTVLCIVLIRTWRMNLSSRLSVPFPPLLPHLHIPITSHMLTFITAMMDYWHPANMTGCHRSLSRDFQTLFPPELTIIEIVYWDWSIDHFLLTLA